MLEYADALDRFIRFGVTGFKPTPSNQGPSGPFYFANPTSPKGPFFKE